MDSALERQRLLSTIFVGYGGSIKLELQDISGVGVTLEVLRTYCEYYFFIVYLNLNFGAEAPITGILE